MRIETGYTAMRMARYQLLIEENIMEYTCDVCKKTHTSDWEDGEAVEEYSEKFGEFDREATNIVCDDCYKKIMAG